MDYREALGRWGAKVASMNPEDWNQIYVDLDLDPGNGLDNSWAESPRVYVEVSHKGRTVYYTEITYDFTNLIREILEVSNGEH